MRDSECEIDSSYAHYGGGVEVVVQVDVDVVVVVIVVVVVVVQAFGYPLGHEYKNSRLS